MADKRIKVKEQTHARFVLLAKIHDEKHDKLMNKLIDYYNGVNNATIHTQEKGRV